MPEEGVGGISVTFTADAAQLKGEIARLEQSLKTFNANYGTQKVTLQVHTPSDRSLIDVRRQVSKAFTEQGVAGQIFAKIQPQTPSANALNQFRAQLVREIGTVPIKVIGNFEWGVRPPSSITVAVKAGPGGAAGEDQPLARQRPARARAAQAGEGSAAAAAAAVEVKAPGLKPAKTQSDVAVAVAPPTRRPTGGSRARAAAQIQPVERPYDQYTIKQLVDDITAGTANRAQQQKMRDELAIRGIEAPPMPARGRTPRMSGGLGVNFMAQAMATGRTVPRTGETGVTPLSSGRIRAMQAAGELPLPYRHLYDPTVSRAPIKTAEFDEQLVRARVRESIQLLPQERAKSGSKWWQQSAQIIAGMGQGTGLTGPQMAGVASMGTNALDWPGTLRAVDQAFENIKQGARGAEAVFRGTQITGRDRAKAQMILESSGTESDVEKILRYQGDVRGHTKKHPGPVTIPEILAQPMGLGAPKVSEMFGGLMGRREAVPLDRHAQALWAGGEIPTKLIPRMLGIVRSELKNLGVNPSRTFPGVWETIGGGDPFGADPWGQLRARTGGGAEAGRRKVNPGALRMGGGLFDDRPRAQRDYDENQKREGRRRIRLMNEAKNDFRGMSVETERRQDREQHRLDLAYIARLDEEEAERSGATAPFTEPTATIGASVPTAAGALRMGGGAGRPRARGLPYAGMRARALEGGFSFDPAAGEFVEPTPGRRHGPYFVSSGKSFSTPAGGSAADFRRVLNQMRAHPENVPELAAGGLIGGWANPESGNIDLDISRRFETRRAARGFLAKRPDQIAGFDLGAGQDIYRTPGGRGLADKARAAVAEAMEQATGTTALPYERFGARPAAAPAMATAEDLAPTGQRTARSVTIPRAGDVVTIPQAVPKAEAAQLSDAAKDLVAIQKQYPDYASKLMEADEGLKAEINALNQRMAQAAAGRGGAAGGGGAGAPPGGGGTRRPGWPGDFGARGGRPAGAAVGAAPANGQPPIDELLQRLGLSEARSPEESQIRNIQEQGRLMLAQARGAGQVRAVGTTLASSIATIFGGRGETAVMQRRMGILITGLGKILDENADKFADAANAKEEYDAAFARGETPTKLAELEKRMQATSKAAEPARNEFKVVANELERIGGGMGRFKAAAVGFASSISGTIAGLAIFSGVQAGLTAIGELGGESIDIMSGFTNEAGKAQKTLGQLTRQMNGFAGEAVASAFAQSGLGENTANSIRPILEQTAAIQAGNSAFEDQAALIKGAFALQTQMARSQRGLAPGPMQTPGGIPGITSSAGGFLGSPFFAQTPLVEQIAEIGPMGTAGQRAGLRATTGGIGAVAGGLVGGALGALTLTPFGVLGGAAAGAAIGGGIGATAGGDIAEQLAGLQNLHLERPGQFARLQGGGAVGPAGPEGKELFAAKGGVGGYGAGAEKGIFSAKDAANMKTFGENTDLALGRVQAMGLAMFDLAEAADRVNPTIAKQVQVEQLLDDTSAEAEDKLRRTAHTLQAMGVSQDQIDSFRAARIAITGPEGERLSRQQGQSFFTAGARGLAIPNAQDAVAGMLKPLAAAIAQIDWQGTFERTVLQPGGQYIEALAAGRAAPGGAAAGRQGITSLPPEIARQAPNFKEIRREIQGVNADLEETQKTGRAALMEMLQFADSQIANMRVASEQGAVAPGQTLTNQFLDLEQSIGNYGTKIRALQHENTWAQVGLQVAQYDEQIRLASQSLQDAISFQSGAGGGELGLLQNRARSLEVSSFEISFQQQELGLQSQELGLQNSLLGIRSRELSLQSTQLQFQSRELGLQADALTLAQRQRQIDFSKATAGFVTPGDTPQMIAARVRENQLEARYAQSQQDIAVRQHELAERGLDLDRRQLPIAEKQLDIDRRQIELQGQQIALARQALGVSREAFNVQQAIVDVNAARAIENLQNQLRLLERGRRVTLRVALNNEAIERFQRRLNRDMETMQSVIRSAYGVQQEVTMRATQLMATYMGTIAKWQNELIGGLSTYLADANRAIGSYGQSGSGTWNPANPGGTRPATNTDSSGNTDERRRTTDTRDADRTPGNFTRAPGYLGMVSAATRITVGEAGPETVAILRNPRSFTPPPPGGFGGGGGGGVNIHVMVTGNQIGGDQQDLDRFANIIARRVEEIQSRRGSLLGLRSL